MGFFVLVITVILLLKLVSSGDYSDPMGCHLQAEDSPGRFLDLGIGFTRLQPIGWSDRIDMGYYWNSVGIPWGRCLFFQWSGSDSKDASRPAEIIYGTTSLFHANLYPRWDISINYNTNGVGVQYHSSSNDNADFADVRYMNDICRVRLYVQNDNTGAYCEITIGEWYQVELWSFCHHNGFLGRCDESWDPGCCFPTLSVCNYGTYDYLSSRGGRSNIYSIGIIGGDKCGVTLANTVEPQQYGSCGTSPTGCITLVGNSDNGDGSEVKFNWDSISAGNPSVTSAWIISANVHRSQGVPTESINWQTLQTNPQATIVQNTAVCLEPGVAGARGATYGQSRTASSANTISISNTYGFTAGWSFEVTAGVPEVAAVKQSISLGVSYSMTSTNSKTLQEGTETHLEIYAYLDGVNYRQAYVTKTTQYWTQPWVCDWSWVDEYGFTQTAPTTGKWSGSVSSYSWTYNIVDNCNGINIPPGGGTGARRRTIASDSSPCILRAYDNMDSMIFESSFGAEMIIGGLLNDNVTFVNVSKLELESFISDADFDCHLYIVSNYSNDNSSNADFNAYSTPVDKVILNESDVIINNSNIHIVNIANLEEFDAIIMIPESRYCKISLWDIENNTQCGPFGVGNHGDHIMFSHSENCKLLLNSTLQLGYIEVEGAQSCLGQLFDSYDHLIGQDIMNYNHTAVWHGPGYNSLQHIDTTFLQSIRGLKVLFYSDLFNVTWDEDTYELKDDNERMILDSDMYINHGPRNSTFPVHFLYMHFRIAQSWFDKQYTTFTWYPSIYAVPLINEIDGSLDISYNAPYNQYAYNNNETVNDTYRFNDLSQYVEWKDSFNVTVPHNSTMECKWTAQHGFLNINVSFTYVRFKNVFIPHYTHDTAFFTRDYIYDLRRECNIIDTPQDFLDSFANVSIFESGQITAIVNGSNTTDDDVTTTTKEADSAPNLLHMEFIILFTCAILYHNVPST